MGDKVILGIHSQTDPNTQGSFNQLIDGHAWISVTRNGTTEHYGLWPDNHPRGLDNGPASDIRTGIEGERGFNPSASRYYELTPEQVTKLEARLRENVGWSYTNTCASWASETTSLVTGQKIDAGVAFSVETPNALNNSLRELERTRPTGSDNPMRPDEIKGRSSSFSALEPGSQVQPASIDSLHPAHSGHPDRALFQHAVAGVRRLDDNRNRPHDALSDNMAASLTVLAKEGGLQRIDHVRLSEANTQVKHGENVFVVQGAMGDPAHLTAHMKTQEAIDKPMAVSFQQLAAQNQKLDEQRSLAVMPESPVAQPPERQARSV
jgi:hypothetical protein